MSQTLALIVAAMVLMMTALTLIFMTQGSLQDLFEGSERESCISTLKSKCTVNSEINVPASCDGITYNGESLSQGDIYSCEDGNSQGSGSIDGEELELEVEEKFE